MVFDEAWFAAHRVKMAGYATSQASPPPANDVEPIAKPKPKAKRRDLETPIHIAIYNFLVLALPEPLEPIHIPNGEWRGKRAAGRLKAMGTRPGAADLLVLGFMRYGVPSFIWIEVKSDEGDLSKAQQDWRDYCKRIAAPWFLVRSVDDVDRSLRSLGIPLKARV